MGGPLTRRRFSIVPVFEIVAASTTVPCIRAAIAIAGYRGSLPLNLRPSITPDEIAGLLGGTTRSCGELAALMESGRPLLGPATPLPKEILPASDGSGSGSAEEMRAGITRGAVKRS